MFSRFLRRYSAPRKAGVPSIVNCAMTSAPPSHHRRQPQPPPSVVWSVFPPDTPIEEIEVEWAIVGVRQEMKFIEDLRKQNQE
jgi:hypothetical protein